MSFTEFTKYQKFYFLLGTRLAIVILTMKNEVLCTHLFQPAHYQACPFSNFLSQALCRAPCPVRVSTLVQIPQPLLSRLQSQHLLVICLFSPFRFLDALLSLGVDILSLRQLLPTSVALSASSRSMMMHDDASDARFLNFANAGGSAAPTRPVSAGPSEGSSPTGLNCAPPEPTATRV